MNTNFLQLKNVLSQLVISHKPVFFVTANPETIDDTDFNFGNATENLNYYKALISDPRKKELIRKADGIILYEYPDKYALLDTLNNKVLYYMQYLEKKILKLPSITQIKVWSSPYSKHTERAFEGNDNITTYVFFKHLFPKREMIVTDRMQTMAGKRFWERRITQAFEQGLKVYGLDQNQNAIIQFHNLKEWIAFADYFYGEENKFQGRKVLITTKFFDNKNIDVFDY